VPFSQLPVDDLKNVRAGLIKIKKKDAATDDDLDHDFAIRYASILLKERGL
jgi:hypothetical protein